MLTWASGDARRVAQRLERANNVSITDITTALGTALRTAGQKPATEEYNPRLDAIFKDHIMALSATTSWRYAVVSDSDTTPETQPIGMDPSQIDGGQLLNLFSSEEAIPAALLPCATKEGRLHQIFLELIPSMSLLACKLSGVPEANAVRVVALDPLLEMTDEHMSFPLLFDGAFPLIQEILYKNAHEFYLIQLRDQITASGVAEISSEQWAQVCMVGGTGDPELSAGGLCSVKIDGVEGSDGFLLHLDGDEQGNGMKVVMCVQPCDAQRLISGPHVAALTRRKNGSQFIVC